MAGKRKKAGGGRIPAAIIKSPRHAARRAFARRFARGGGRAAADEVDDLDPVARPERGRAVAGFRHHLAIAFDRDLAPVHPHLRQQLLDGEGALERARFAVDGELHG
jgi:hypothetical protein